MSSNDNKRINIRKRYFNEVTYMNLLNALDAYEKKDYMAFIIWASVFNERFINDLALNLNVDTKSKTVQGLARSIRTGIRSSELEEQLRINNILDESLNIQRIRSVVVHTSVDTMDYARRIYNELQSICEIYAQTNAASEYARKQQQQKKVTKIESGAFNLELNNIGKISKASIMIDGLTVIVGENATGKSTVGKSLYLITNTLKKMENEILESQTRNISEVIRNLYKRYSGNFTTPKSTQELIKELAKCPPSRIRNLVLSESQGWKKASLFWNGDLPSEIERTIEEITQIRSMSYNELSQQFVTNEIYKAFRGRICKIGTKTGTIELRYRDNSINSITISKAENGDECIQIVYDQDILADTCMIDDYYYSASKNQRNDEEQDVIESYNTKVLTKQLSKTLSILVNGRIVMSDGKQYFEEDGIPELIEMTNLSDGVKEIAKLDWMLRQNKITRDGILILDEPELRLHPEWQIKYAQIIVQLQKQLNLHILLTTHSPYFLQALEYSAKLQGIEKRYHCYLAESSNEVTRISCVDNYPSYAYKKMIEPFVKLDEMREEVKRREENGDTADET